MRKLFFPVALLAIFSFSFLSRTGAQEGFQMGIQGIPQLTWVLNQDDSDNANFDFMTTFKVAFGITAQYGISENLGIGLDALYSMQGQKFTLLDVERNKELQYLKVPVMLVFNHNFTPDVMFIGKIGPQFGYLLDAKLTDVDGNELVTAYDEAYEDFDIGGVLSAGVGFKLSESVFLDAALRFDYGATNAENQDYTGNIDTPDDGGTDMLNRASSHNMTGGLSVGFRYLFD